MGKISATKTVNPLHFEDLEPRRFEDLVRQLIYDFKKWYSLEATGRLGSDDGFDIRGLEVEYEDETSDILDDENTDNDAIIPTPSTERIWQIQCKREKTIAPKKLSKYIDDIVDEKKPPYGFIFVAACDFSKKARDLYINKIREKGIQEFHIWGKAELEDMLFQPKNDNLLFAYFGISLLVKRRLSKTKIRTILASKRKVVRHIGGVKNYTFQPVLIRNIDDTNYPYSKEIADFDKYPRWEVFSFNGHCHNGIKFQLNDYLAYVDDDRKGWDFVEGVKKRMLDDTWKSETKSKIKGLEHYDVYQFWEKNVPENNRFKYYEEGLIKYERIVDIDPEGDEFFSGPHIFVTGWDKKQGPFDGEYQYFEHGSSYNREVVYPDPKKRLKFFPKKFPKAKKTI